MGGMWTAWPEGAPGGPSTGQNQPHGRDPGHSGGASLTLESSSPPESHPFFKSTLHERQLCACLALRPGREQKPSALGVRVTSYQNKVQIEHTEAETTKRRQAQGWEKKLIVCEGDSGHSTAR